MPVGGGGIMLPIQLAANYLKFCLLTNDNNLSAKCTGSSWRTYGLEGQRLVQVGKVPSFQVWMKPACHYKVNKLIQQDPRKVPERWKVKTYWRQSDFYNFSWQYPTYTSHFSVLTEGSLGITEALCYKINASVKLLSWITPKECNDSVSKMLTTAELRSFHGSTTKTNAWYSFQGSGWQHLQLFTFFTPLSILPLLKSSNTTAFGRNLFYPIVFTCAERKKQWSCKWIYFHSFNYRAGKDCWRFIHMLGS